MRRPIPAPCLCLVTDRRLCSGDFGELERRVEAAVKGGVGLVHLREKDLPAGRLLEVAERLRAATKGAALLFVNDRVDAAMACGADGVQLGEEGMPAGAARAVAGEGLLIGRSVHDVEGAIAAEAQGADFLLVGTVFPTGSHAGVEPEGLQLLSRVAGRTALPFAGIGGIKAANVGAIIGAGASGAAVISAILGAADPERAARELKEAMEAEWHPPHAHEHGAPLRAS